MMTFAGCELDVDGRRLLRDGQLQPLEPQAFDVLVYLLQHRGRVVSKDELLDAVWGDRWVSESALTTRVKEVRRAIGDSGESQAMVRTVRSRGYQFVADVAERSEEAPASTRRTATLVGRDRDLDELLDRVAPGSLVTLVGPGGVGKTTLARALASRLRDRFPDGCFAIDLAVVHDRDELTAVIARATQIAVTSPTTLPEALRTLDALLLLDDADELIPEVASLCTALRSAHPRISLLVTCRERLGATDERIWPVLPLSDDAAVDLLAIRARDLAPLGSVASASPAQLAALAESVDHLPLALEMVASSSAYLDVGELIDLVSQHPELLTDPRREAPSRHRTLDVLVTDSLQRLDAQSRTTLTAISCFAGSFRLVDAAAVVGPDGGGLTSVRGLVDRSLLSPSISSTEGPRFHLLRTVRRAVQVQSEAHELTAWHRRHAEWVAAELEAADRRLRSADELAGAGRISEIADEARVAHSWARQEDTDLALRITATVHLYAHSRLWSEPAQWARSIPHWRDHGVAVAAAASQASQEGNLDEAWSLGHHILEDGSTPVRAWALEVLSDVALYRGALDSAKRWTLELMELGVQKRDPRMVALGLTNGALARVYSGDSADALALLDSTTSTSPTKGPISPAPTDLAWLEYARGEALAIAKRPGAESHLLEAARLGDSVESRFVAGVARSTLASILVDHGDADAASNTYRELLTTFRRHGITTHLTISLRNVVALLIQLRADREAAVLCGWVLGPRARPGYGAEVETLRAQQRTLRATHGDAVVEAWEAEGAGLTAADATSVALSVLEAGHDVESASPAS